MDTGCIDENRSPAHPTPQPISAILRPVGFSALLKPLEKLGLEINLERDVIIFVLVYRKFLKETLEFQI